MTAPDLSPDLSFDQVPVFRKHYAMGTVFEIATYGANLTQASQAMDHAFQEIDRLEQVMSLYKTTSDLSQLNRTAHLQAQTVSPDLYQVIQESQHYSELSDGAFDITAGPLAERWKAVGRGEQAPSPAEERELRRGVGYRQVELIPSNRIHFHSSRVAVDLGAIGKGYAVDRAAAVLRFCGIECALINSGGSTFYAIGCPPGQSGWLVHLCDPSARIWSSRPVEWKQRFNIAADATQLAGTALVWTHYRRRSGRAIEIGHRCERRGRFRNGFRRSFYRFLADGPSEGTGSGEKITECGCRLDFTQGSAADCDQWPINSDDKRSAYEPSKSCDPKSGLAWSELMDRRRFVKSAGLGTAGLLLSSVVLKGQDDATQPESPVIPQIAWGRVWIRWTEPTLPAKTLLAHGLAIPWDASPALMESARKQGYRVYATVTLAQASTAASDSRAMGISGIILETSDSDQAKVQQIAVDLRLAHPNLTVLSPDPNAKQPAMIGSTVISRHGILQISSPTEQPWISSNIAMVAYDRAFFPTQTPVIDFQWELSDALQQQLGPSTEDYLLAVAEAGAIHSDLILNSAPESSKIFSERKRPSMDRLETHREVRRVLPRRERTTRRISSHRGRGDGQLRRLV